MPTLPNGFHQHAAETVAAVRDVDGQLREREIRFLALVAACPTAAGEILEIGSFKGKSTIVLARGALLAGERKVHAVDPMTGPAATDPSLGDQASSLADFNRNLDRAGVGANVELHQTTSDELAATWSARLRLLWIDGDHTYRGTKSDFDNFVPHLVDRGILVMDDVLRLYSGPSRVFAEDVLLSPHFGACGVIGKLGWAQYLTNPQDARPYEALKQRLYRRTRRLIPYASAADKPRGLRKLGYKLTRFRVPHGGVEPERWLAMLR